VLTFSADGLNLMLKRGDELEIHSLKFDVFVQSSIVVFERICDFGAPKSQFLFV